MQSERQIEEELIRGLKKIAVPYRKALDILREHNAAQGQSQTAATVTDTDVCLRLKPSMEMIADYEVALAPLRIQWNGLEKSADGELQQLIDEQSLVLQELISRIDSVQQAVTGSRHHLASRLDVSQRQNAMRQAYQA